jgi:hypothetical protein
MTEDVGWHCARAADEVVTEFSCRTVDSQVAGYRGGFVAAREAKNINASTILRSSSRFDEKAIHQAGMASSDLERPSQRKAWQWRKM